MIPSFQTQCRDCGKLAKKNSLWCRRCGRKHIKPKRRRRHRPRAPKEVRIWAQYSRTEQIDLKREAILPQLVKKNSE